MPVTQVQEIDCPLLASERSYKRVAYPHHRHGHDEHQHTHIKTLICDHFTTLGRIVRRHSLVVFLGCMETYIIYHCLETRSAVCGLLSKDSNGRDNRKVECAYELRFSQQSCEIVTLSQMRLNSEKLKNLLLETHKVKELSHHTYG